MDVTDNPTALPSAPEIRPALTQEEILDAIARASGALDAEETTEALRHAREEIDTLKEALRTRTIIGQATGLLMSEHALTAEAAFSRLVEMSQNTNVKLRDIATEMVSHAGKRSSAGARLLDPGAFT
jgi:AmiR/NasT family two-component response regulator